MAVGSVPAKLFNSTDFKSNLFPFDDVSLESSDGSSQKGGNGVIREFERDLRKPMIPDFNVVINKAKDKFPVIIQRAGWVLALIIAVMYAALGLVGFLIFLSGIIFLGALQGMIIMRYIENEKTRVKEREINAEVEREEEDNQCQEEDDPLSHLHDID